MVAAAYRASALEMLARSPKVEAEARRAYATEKGRRRHEWAPDGPIALAAAEKAAADARARTSEHLLAAWLDQLRTTQEQNAADAMVPAPRSPWADRLAELAARPLDDEVLGAIA
ncbi:hypothetical protein J7I98_39370 [Streptomyces sp. ISL-98]|nr:hypothetical protein [Streptomyces sp. ISL-98]